MKQVELSPDIKAILYDNGCLGIVENTETGEDVIFLSGYETEELRKLLTQQTNENTEASKKV